MYAGVIRSAVHTTFRRSLTIATVHARFNLTQIAYEGRKKSEPLHFMPRGGRQALYICREASLLWAWRGEA
jgi:hypothetical protein